MAETVDRKYANRTVGREGPINRTVEKRTKRREKIKKKKKENENTYEIKFVRASLRKKMDNIIAEDDSGWGLRNRRDRPTPPLTRSAFLFRPVQQRPFPTIGRRNRLRNCLLSDFNETERSNFLKSETFRYFPTEGQPIPCNVDDSFRASSLKGILVEVYFPSAYTGTNPRRRNFTSSKHFSIRDDWKARDLCTSRSICAFCRDLLESYRREMGIAFTHVRKRARVFRACRHGVYVFFLAGSIRSF